MFHNIFIKLKSVNGFQPNDNFISLLDYYINALCYDNLFIECINSSYMTESNDCVTLAFTIKDKRNISNILDFLNGITRESILDFDFDLKSEFHTVIVKKNELLTFFDSKIEPLFNQNNTPSELHKILAKISKKPSPNQAGMNCA